MGDGPQQPLRLNPRWMPKYVMRTPRKDSTMFVALLGHATSTVRHIKNFTYTSAILTDLINKSSTWRWGPQEQQAFDELRDKVANAR